MRLVVIDGGPERAEAWTTLTELLGETRPHPSGAFLGLAKLAIDTGYEAPAVYAWARRMGSAQVVAIKGVEGFSRAAPVVGPTYVDATEAGRRIRRGAKLWTVAAATVAANPATTEARSGAKQQLLAACQAAEHWLQAERDRPGETWPDEILRVLRAAIERAEGERKPREPRRPDQLRQSSPRESTKEALLIDMLRRPEGATIAQIMTATGWQAHTCRGAFAGALKKKRGLTVTSEKPEGGSRVYRLAD